MPAEKESDFSWYTLDVKVRLDFRSKLRSWWVALHAEEPLQKAIVAAHQDFVEERHQRRGLAMMIPSTVGVPAATSSITSLRRSPAALSQLSAGVLSSDGVTPAVPPPCTGVRSRMVSDPLYIVIRLPVVVLRTRSRIDAGHGRYSYCQPASGFRPSWLAVIAVLKTNCGISVDLLSKAPDRVRSLTSRRGSDRRALDWRQHLHSKEKHRTKDDHLGTYGRVQGIR